MERRPHRAVAELVLHVLDIMDAAAASADAGRHVEFTPSCERPAALLNAGAAGWLAASPKP